MGNSSSSNGQESAKDALHRSCGWVPDSDRAACFHCETAFSFFSTRRHHCRLCGEVFCDDSQCWGIKVLLPPHLYVESDPLSPSNKDVTAVTSGLPFLSTPQPVCRVCAEVLLGPMRKIALSLPESAISRAASLNRSLWADANYRHNAAEYVMHVNVVAVGQKADESPRMFNVNRCYRLRLDAWRPFNKATKLAFVAVDATDEDPGSPETPTPRSRSGSTASNGSPRGGAPSAMQRTRRKSRTDLILDMPNKENEENQMTLPARWNLGGTAIFNCEVVHTPIEAVRLETYSDIIMLAPEPSVAPHFTLTSADLFQVIKQAVDHSRVRGKVRLSSVKPANSKFQKRSKT